MQGEGEPIRNAAGLTKPQWERVAALRKLARRKDERAQHHADMAARLRAEADAIVEAANPEPPHADR